MLAARNLGRAGKYCELHSLTNKVRVRPMREQPEGLQPPSMLRPLKLRAGRASSVAGETQRIWKRNLATSHWIEPDARAAMAAPGLASPAYTYLCNHKARPCGCSLRRFCGPERIFGGGATHHGNGLVVKQGAHEKSVPVVEGLLHRHAHTRCSGGGVEEGDGLVQGHGGRLVLRRLQSSVEFRLCFAPLPNTSDNVFQAPPLP